MCNTFKSLRSRLLLMDHLRYNVDNMTLKDYCGHLTDHLSFRCKVLMKEINKSFYIYLQMNLLL